MRLRELHLVNCRPHEDTHLKLERVNWFGGDQEVGKTTIGEALRLLLGGQNKWVKFKQNRLYGLSRWISRGGSQCQVSVVEEFQKKNGTVERNDLSIRVSEASKEKLSHMFDPDLVADCLDTRHFLQQDARYQQGRLFDLMGLSMGADAYLAELKKMPGGEAMVAWMTPFMEAALAHKDGPGDWCYKQRTPINSMVKKFKAKVDDGAPEEPPKPDQSAAGPLRVNRDKLVIEKSNLTKPSTDRRQYEAELATWNEMRRNRETAEAMLAKEHSTPITPPNGPEYLDQILTEDLGKATPALLAAIAKKSSINDEMKSLGESKICTNGKCAKSEMARLQKELAAADTAVASAKAKVDELQKKQESNLAANRVWKEYDKRKKDLEERKSAAQSVVNALPALPERPSEPRADVDPNPELSVVLQVKIAALDAQLDELKNQEIAHIAWARDFSHYMQDVDDLKEYQAQAKMWDALVDAFDAKKGIPAIVLDGAKGALSQRANDSAKWFGKKVTFSWPWQIWLNDDPQDGLTGAQEAQLSAVLQTMIADLSGIGQVCIDEHGMSPLHRPELLDFCLAHTSVQFYVMSLLNKVEMRDDELVLVPPTAIDEPDVATWWIEKPGVVKRMEVE